MLIGKVAVITGASSGLGASLATRLSQDGCTVVLAARRREKLEEVAGLAESAGGTVLPVQCDVSVCREAEELIQKTVETFGKIDILVNNAGRGHFSSVEETTDDVIESMFTLNVFALWYTTRPALRHMKHQGNGHIINIASMAGKLGFPYNSAYVAAKHACVGFTHALRLELAETGIHATVVCPGGAHTEWAEVTEGSPISGLFSEAGPVIKRIAAERGISLPRIEGVLSADAVAEQIRACIETPVAEVFTHKGSHEFSALAARNREQAERHQLPVALGERYVYERLKSQA
jgi:short-subunit dehydrogenase